MFSLLFAWKFSLFKKHLMYIFVYENVVSLQLHLCFYFLRLAVMLLVLWKLLSWISIGMLATLKTTSWKLMKSFLSLTRVCIWMLFIHYHILSNLLTTYFMISSKILTYWPNFMTNIIYYEIYVKTYILQSQQNMHWELIWNTSKFYMLTDFLELICL